MWKYRSLKLKNLKAPKLKQQQTRESLRGARDSNNDFREINSSRIMLDARSYKNSVKPRPTMNYNSYNCFNTVYCEEKTNIKIIQFAVIVPKRVDIDITQHSM